MTRRRRSGSRVGTKIITERLKNALTGQLFYSACSDRQGASSGASGPTEDRQRPTRAAHRPETAQQSRI
ncbi:hypothetical protein E3U43_003027 [Larimichthys crocea]|nr:hypothetical protein E3U43_003027 [Larimichthys crocea]